MIADPSIEEQLAHAKQKIKRLEAQLNLEREWLLLLIHDTGNCQKCRFFTICGPQYDCRKTVTRKLAGHIKRIMN